MKKLLFIIYVIFLIGCSNSTTQLSTPLNIRVIDSNVVWDTVENATYYTIKIDEFEFEVNVPEFNYTGIGNGQYSVQVRAHNANSKSNYSKPVMLSFMVSMPVPSNILIEANILHFDPVVDAQSYEIYVDNTLLVETNDVSVDLSILQINHVYKISVKTIFESATSLLSTEVLFFHFTVPNDTLTYSINQNRTHHFYIKLNDSSNVSYVIFEGKVVKKSSYYQVDDILYIDNSLLTVETSTHLSIQVIYDNLRVDYRIELFQDDKPFMVSPTNLYYKNSDTEVLFELFNGEIAQLSAKDLTKEDYIVQHDLLIIKKSYIERVLLSYPDTSNLVITYEILDNEDSIIGFFIIKIR